MTDAEKATLLQDALVDLFLAVANKPENLEAAVRKAMKVLVKVDPETYGD